MKKKGKGISRFVLAILLLATLPMAVLAAHSILAASPAAGGYSTVVYARLLNDGADVTANANFEVKAFVGDDLRGEGRTLSLPDNGTVLVLRIWGDTGVGGTDETGQVITFKVHSLSTGKDYDVTTDETITFRGDYTYGMPSAPVTLRFSLGSDVEISGFTVVRDHLIVYQNEGDIRERMNALVKVQPAESTQTFHWELTPEAAIGIIEVNDSTGDINAARDGEVTMVAVADANPAVRSAAVTVTVMNPARTLLAAQDNITFYLSGQGSLDVSDDVNSLIHIGPQGYTSIDLSYVSSDPSVLSTRLDEAKGRWEFLAHKAGSSVVTTSLTYLNCYTEEDTTLTMDIAVYVSMPITGISATVASLQVCRDSVAVLTLKAVPEGAVISAENINLTLADPRIARVGDFEVGEGASSVEIPVMGLFPGTTSVLNALEPNGKAQSIGGIDVVVPLQLSKGWQWVTCYQPTHISGKALEAAFGNSLVEVRSQSHTLFNDPDYGYIGSLCDVGLEQNVCYKINMAADASHIFEKAPGTVAPYAGGSLYLDGQWHWIANPYYYTRSIEDYVSGVGDDDMIVGQNAFAVFSDGQWFGSLKTLRYGEAYMYYADAGYVDLTFKAEGYEVIEEDEEEFEDESENEEEDVKSLASDKKEEGRQDASRRGNNVFIPSGSRRFMDNMCMIAALGDGFSAMEDCQIGAFVDGECRGKATITDGRFFLTVHGDAGETVSLQLYDPNSGTYYHIEGTTELQPRIGSMRAPLLIHRDSSDTLVLGIPEAGQQDCYYTLQGIRLSQPPQKGIYIYKGRKVAVR